MEALPARAVSSVPSWTPGVGRCTMPCSGWKRARSSALSAECEAYGPALVLFGDGAALCHKTFSAWGARLAPESQRYQQASSVAFLGFKQAEQGLAVSGAELLPVYLRLPQAERELKRKKEKEGN